MITLTFWPCLTRANTVDIGLNHTSRFEAEHDGSTFYLCHSDSQHLLDALWASGMRPSHQQGDKS